MLLKVTRTLEHRLREDLLAEPSDTFLYRDFNARNVMLVDGEPYFIDFQGGRRGPVYYDVASFLLIAYGYHYLGLMGAGIGLSLSRQIMRQHNGTIDLIRSDARQTVFQLVFR